MKNRSSGPTDVASTELEPAVLLEKSNHGLVCLKYSHIWMVHSSFWQAIIRSEKNNRMGEADGGGQSLTVGPITLKN